MFFTQEKLKKRVEELGFKRYFGHQCVAPFASAEGELSEDEHYHNIPSEIKGSLFYLNDFFVGRNGYLWLKKTVTLPEKKDGCEVVGLFDFGKTGLYNGSRM